MEYKLEVDKDVEEIWAQTIVYIAAVNTQITISIN